MTHPLVEQLRFTRGEWLRGLDGVSEEDGARRFGRMNSIGWTVGHLAWQEQYYWLQLAQGTVLVTELNERYASGSPASTPSLREMLDAWHRVTEATNPYLDQLTTHDLQQVRPGRSSGHNVGSALQRMIYHYWYHLGEILAVRQMLGQRGLPEYVGYIEAEAPFRPA